MANGKKLAGLVTVVSVFISGWAAWNSYQSRIDAKRSSLKAELAIIRAEGSRHEVMLQCINKLMKTDDFWRGAGKAIPIINDLAGDQLLSKINSASGGDLAELEQHLAKIRANSERLTTITIIEARKSMTPRQLEMFDAVCKDRLSTFK